MGDRDVGDVVAGGHDLARQAFALGADDERQIAVAGSSPSGTPSRATSATRRPGSSDDVAHARDGHGEQRAHRGADGLVPVRVGAAGAERDRVDAPNASAERMTVPTLPGSPTPHSATQSGPAGGRPALRVDADRARARAELGDSASTCGATGMPSSPLPVAA